MESSNIESVAKKTDSVIIADEESSGRVKSDLIFEDKSNERTLMPEVVAVDLEAKADHESDQAVVSCPHEGSLKKKAPEPSISDGEASRSVARDPKLEGADDVKVGLRSIEKNGESAISEPGGSHSGASGSVMVVDIEMEGVDETIAKVMTCQKKSLARDGGVHAKSATTAAANAEESSSTETIVDGKMKEKCLASCTSSKSDVGGKLYAAERPTYSFKYPLPEGWREVYHESGATVYVQCDTGICSVSRPYKLENFSLPIRYIPTTAVPCYSYRHNKDENFLRNYAAVAGAAAGGGSVDRPIARKRHEKLMEYCSRLFQFTTVKYPKFHSRGAKRSYKLAKREEELRREQDEQDGDEKRWRLNPRGRSYVAILREYLLQSRKTVPVYQYSKWESDELPYAAAVLIDGVGFGAGVGASQKEAKFEAAKDTLSVLLPNMTKYVFSVSCEKAENKFDDGSSDEEEKKMEAVAGGVYVTKMAPSPLDDFEIGDPRILDLSAETSSPTPYDMLLLCMRRRGYRDDELRSNFQNQFETCTMSLRQCQTRVSCANLEEGKQRAAQSLLELLHPHVSNWGALRRLYGGHHR